MKISKTLAVVQGMAAMRLRCSAWLQNRDVKHRSPPMRNHVLMLILVSLAGLVSGCISPKRVGWYPVTGTVVDRCTRGPVKGATVFLRYSGVSFFSGPVEVDGEPVLTNELGQFYIPPKSRTLIGGSGGFAGEIRKWPTVTFYKAGLGRGSISKYLQKDKASISPQDYQAMTLEIGYPCDSKYRNE